MKLNFKAYIKPLNEIKEVYGFDKEHVFLDSLDTAQIGVNVFRRVDCVILQSTGYKDSLGEYIYEGDIVKLGGYKRIITQGNAHGLYQYGLIDICEVIGNINLISK